MSRLNYNGQIYDIETFSMESHHSGIITIKGLHHINMNGRKYDIETPHHGFITIIGFMRRRLAIMFKVFDNANF